MSTLFISKLGRRIGTRRVQFTFATWQRRAEFERIYIFHHLRHSAITNVLYTHLRDEELDPAIVGR